MQLGHGEGRASIVVFNSYVVTETGEQYLQSPKALMLPVVDSFNQSTILNANESLTSKKTQRQSKGKHLLPVL